MVNRHVCDCRVTICPLHAAAPDLLAALRLMLDATDYTAGACRNEMVGAVLDKVVIDRARAAIRAATGGGSHG